MHSLNHVPDPDPRETYASALRHGDSSAIVDLMRSLLDAEAHPTSILTDVVAAVQRDVGERWESGEWTVAQEHSATAIAITATKVVAEHVQRIPVTRGSVVIACAEREWHALPAMIIDCALRAAGWRTTLLGASTTTGRLAQHLQDEGPDAVAVSCSMLGSLPACRRFIEASTANGIPILVGGPAFGDDDRRARALGATAWAPDAHRAIAAIDTMPTVVDAAAPLPKAVVAEHTSLAENHRTLVATLRARWSSVADLTTTVFDAPHSVMDVADDIVHQLLYSVGAALLTGDVRPVEQVAAWVTGLVRTRGGDDVMLGELFDVLTATLREYPLAQALVAEHATGSGRRAANA